MKTLICWFTIAEVVLLYMVAWTLGAREVE